MRAMVRLFLPSYTRTDEIYGCHRRVFRESRRNFILAHVFSHVATNEVSHATANEGSNAATFEDSLAAAITAAHSLAVAAPDEDAHSTPHIIARARSFPNPDSFADRITHGRTDGCSKPGSNDGEPLIAAHDAQS